MVERQLPKLHTRVRFPSPALFTYEKRGDFWPKKRQVRTSSQTNSLMFTNVQIFGQIDLKGSTAKHAPSLCKVRHRTVVRNSAYSQKTALVRKFVWSGILRGLVCLAGRMLCQKGVGFNLATPDARHRRPTQIFLRKSRSKVPEK